MDINNNKHIVNKILGAEDLNTVTTEIFYISVAKNLDCIYKSCDIVVEKEVKNWYLEHTIENLKELKKEDKFSCFNYNNEISIHDSIAVIDTKEQEGPLKTNLDLLKKAIINDTGKINNNCRFHLLKASLDSEEVFFCYYKGIKRQHAKKKYLKVIEGREFEAIDDKIVELGGKLDFIVFKEKIYIINPRNFEFAFQYSDHITAKRDKNLEKIAEIDIFKKDSDKELFKNRASHHLMARGIAQISDEDLKALKANFSDRCNDLREIKKTIKEEPEKEKELRSALGILIDLTNYIDLEEDKIIFNENDDPKPLLYMFEDKIMESYLTKKVITILAKKS